jgi:hypothetical protein
MKIDGFVKSPSVRFRRMALHFRPCGLPIRGPSASDLTRLGARNAEAFFPLATPLLPFGKIIKIRHPCFSEGTFFHLDKFWGVFNMMEKFR